MNNLKISIITVSYNAEATIEQAIKSVLSQSYNNVEYIIVDGGSTDGTIDIVRKYERDIAFWVSESDQGVYDAMNKGIRYCTGDVIAFLNSDDYYLEGALEHVADCYNKNGQLDILCCEVFLEKDGELSTHKNPWVNRPEKLQEGYMMYSHQGIFARKHCFQVEQAFDLNYKIVADYNWLLGCYNKGVKIVYSLREVAVFRWGGLSTNNLIKTAEELRTAATLAAKNKWKQGMISKGAYENLCCKINNMIGKRYIDAYAELEGLINLKVKTQKNDLFQHNKYMIFGAGGIGINCLKVLRALGLDVVCFVDNSSDKWGKCLEGIPVISLQDALLKEGMLMVASLFYEQEIIKQLREKGMIENINYMCCGRVYEAIEISDNVEIK